MKIHAYIENMDFPIVEISTEFGDRVVDYSHLKESSTQWISLESAWKQENMVLFDTNTLEIDLNVETLEFFLEELREEPVEIKSLSELSEVVNRSNEDSVFIIEIDSLRGVTVNDK
jgi:hypothetical protein